MSEFDYDEGQAKKAGKGGGVSTSGIYSGKIKQAYVHEFDSGAKAIKIEFDFNGTKANGQFFMTKKDGSPAFSAGLYHALIGLLDLKSDSQPSSARVELYDFDEGKMVQQTHPVAFPQLVGRPINVYLQKSEYLGTRDGKVKFNMNVKQFYNHDNQSLFEFTEKLEAEEFKKANDMWPDELVQQAPQPAAASMNDDFDDDIPFR